ncbi:MAG: AI-2E family transporter [Actinomycetota bacterium]|nr:AI-2E family transporter [Actinomycetota bacterium]
MKGEVRPRTDVSVPWWLRVSVAWSWRLLVVVAALVVLAWGLAKLYLVVLPVIAAIILATFLVPPSRWLSRHKVPSSVAAISVVFGGIVAVLLVLAFATQQFVAQADELAASSLRVRDQVVHWLQVGAPDLSPQEIDNLINQAREQVRSNRGKLALGLLVGSALVLEGVGATLLTLVLLFYVVRDGEKLLEWAVGHLPADRRPLLAALWSRAWKTLGDYFLGIPIFGLLNAVPVGLVLLVLGVPLVVPLMLLIFAAAFFPIVGAIVAGLLAVLVTFASDGLVAGLAVLATILVAKEVSGRILYPYIMGHMIPLHPAVILVVLTAGAVLWGIAGAALAVPVAAVLSAVGNEWRRFNEEEEEEEEEEPERLHEQAGARGQG